MSLTDETARRMAMLLHHRKATLAQGDPVIPPIVASATFHLPSVQSGGQFYGRNGNPTWDAVEVQLSILEDAEAVSFPSGMAAISAALFATLKAGDRLVIPSDGYYVTRVLSEGFLKPLGIGVQPLPTASYGTADFTGVAVVYLETPSNPGLDVVDIATVAARAKAAGATVIADNTTMTPL
ncbi:MAG: PLP-dependent transferase, partial [Tabrizicola sp.]|nr:PLP-dependent transferase [Tabrizicola sp.]